MNAEEHISKKTLVKQCGASLKVLSKEIPCYESKVPLTKYNDRMD